MTSQEYFYRLSTDQEQGPWAGFLKAGLLFFSWCYGVAVSLLVLFYKKGFLTSRRLPVPVISVGNITWGGVGKTPLVELIVGFLLELRQRPVILTRGYMGESQKARAGSLQISDEAELLKAALGSVPVMVSPDRLAAARQALRDHAVKSFVLDDGFQHWRVLRDLDIVVIDATNPFGNGRLIPRGILRESTRALARAHLFVMTKTDLAQDHLALLKARLKEINLQAPVVESIHHPCGLEELTPVAMKKGLAYLQGRRIGAFCAIGDPLSFKKTLQNCGAQVDQFFSFRDHYLYQKEDLESILVHCRQQHLDTLVTTQKDAVKLTPFLPLFGNDRSLFALKIQLQLTEGKDEFYRRISRLF